MEEAEHEARVLAMESCPHSHPLDTAPGKGLRRGGNVFPTAAGFRHYLWLKPQLIQLSLVVTVS